ncbi:MAG TPA: DUF5615 family PIN-like protein [Chloroflexota bacterium]|nr:DUF5615 family PIN-like protein [Chloroflexota bacterium]
MAEIRFQLDEHLGRAVANGLRRRGVEAATTAELGLLGATDEQQIESALRLGRVIATFDPDFIRLTMPVLNTAAWSISVSIVAPSAGSLIHFNSLLKCSRATRWLDGSSVSEWRRREFAA